MFNFRKPRLWARVNQHVGMWRVVVRAAGDEFAETVMLGLAGDGERGKTGC